VSSDKIRTVIKHQHVRHRERLVVLGLLSLSAALVVGYFLGQRAAYTGYNVEPGVNTSDLEQQLLAVKEAQEVQSIQHDLDSAALAMVRQEITAQKELIANLEEGLGFYKGLMAPEAIKPGLSLRKLELVATEVAGRFGFRLVAQQAALKHSTLKGSLSIELFGLRGGEQASYALADLSSDIEGGTIPLRFRYFQSIDGELVLPESFTPQGFRVVAQASSPQKVELREQFPWEVQKRFTYVGK